MVPMGLPSAKILKFNVSPHIGTGFGFKIAQKVTKIQWKVQLSNSIKVMTEQKRHPPKKSHFPVPEVGITFRVNPHYGKLSFKPISPKKITWKLFNNHQITLLEDFYLPPFNFNPKKRTFPFAVGPCLWILSIGKGLCFPKICLLLL